MWGVALLVLVTAVLVEFALLHERLAQDVRQLRDAAGRPEQHTALPADLPPVTRPAPPSAGVLGGVGLRAVAPCTPGAACTIRVLVQLEPQSEAADQQLASRLVRWSFRVAERCTGNQHSAAGGVVLVPPGSDQLQAVNAVPLPAGRALAVMAVTSEPAQVASEPLLVPARHGACTEN
jgi:hypothetical protein